MGGEGDSWQRGKIGLLKIGFPFLVGLQTPGVPLPVPSLPPFQGQPLPRGRAQPWALALFPLRAGGVVCKGLLPTHLPPHRPCTFPTRDWDPEPAARERGACRIFLPFEALSA